MDEPSAQVVREWIVDRVTLIVDNNNEHLYAQVCQAARDAVLELPGDGDPRERFLEALRTGDLRGYADAVGDSVCEVIGEWVEDSIEDENLRTMVQDLLDFGDRRQRAVFGEHYMPEAGDFEAER